MLSELPAGSHVGPCASDLEAVHLDSLQDGLWPLEGDMGNDMFVE